MNCRIKLDSQTTVHYTNRGSSYLPEIKVYRGGKCLLEAKGSSVGPRNYQCRPDETDIRYWRALVAEAEGADPKAGSHE